MIPHARVVLRIVRDDEVTPEARQALPAAPYDWFGLADRAANAPKPERRRAAVDYWFENQNGTRPDVVRAMRRALAEAEAMPEPPEATGPTEKASPPFDLELIDTETFFAESYELVYLVSRVLVAGEACVFAGPSKALKTSFLLDLAISLASATPFLGQYRIENPSVVGFISGESGKRTIQRNAKRVCDERNLPYSMAANIHWGFKLPTLTLADHLAVLKETIAARGIQIIILDPLYLMLVSGNSGVDTKDMNQVGRLLKSICDTCIEAGATPIICHHFVKNREDNYKRPELGEAAGAGIHQVFRQWMLVGRRSAYDPLSGLHSMYFDFGGSAGHSGQVDLDISTGCLDDEGAGNLWRVAVNSPQQTRLNEQEERKARNEQKALDGKAKREEGKQAEERVDMGMLLEVLRKEPGGIATVSTIREETGWRLDKAKRIAALCKSSGAIRSVAIPRVNGKGEPYDGYALVAPPKTGGGTLEFDPVR